ncbi:MAG: hypothetical protein QM572_06665, partial [Nocardioides sp.]|uniref:hypothetical protein n=1 Tax=Nocardioides sp. TaxID=35761 RepID=UPI0039E44AC7
MAIPTSSRTLSYRPGSWLGIVGVNATVLLPGSEKARAGALWSLVDDGAGFDAVLDALVAGGLSALPGFVLLSATDENVRVLVRGGASATFDAADGPLVVAADAGSMWSERTVPATDFAITLPDEPAEGQPLAVTDGLVRLGSLETPSSATGLAPVVHLAPLSSSLADSTEIPAADVDFLSGELPPAPTFPPPPAPPAAVLGAELDLDDDLDDEGDDESLDDLDDGEDELDELVEEPPGDVHDPLLDPLSGDLLDEAPTDDIPVVEETLRGAPPSAPPSWTPAVAGVPPVPVPPVPPVVGLPS